MTIYVHYGNNHNHRLQWGRAHVSAEMYKGGGAGGGL